MATTLPADTVVTELAQQFIERHSLHSIKNLRSRQEDYLQIIYRDILPTLTAEQLLAIVYSGKAKFAKSLAEAEGVALFDIHGHRGWLNEHASGEEIVGSVAAAALMARIYELLQKRPANTLLLPQ